MLDDPTTATGAAGGARSPLEAGSRHEAAAPRIIDLRAGAEPDRPIPDATAADSVCVFAPSIELGVVIEPDVRGGSWGEIHFHPAGQGFWIARLLGQLGYRAVLCGPIGGEVGAVIERLVPEWGVTLRSVPMAASNAAFIDDRRSGARVLVAREARAPLHRHEVDDLYGRVLEMALSTAVTVVTGRRSDDPTPLDIFERLGADLTGLGITTIGDLHGAALRAFLEHGSLSILKVSDDDLLADGEIGDRSEAAILAAMERLAARNIDWIVVSMAERGAMVSLAGELHRVVQPRLSVVDERGCGDSMTAALVAGRLRGLDPEHALRLACAAGAANVTRHGLGGASADLVEALAGEVEIQRIGPKS